MSNHVRNGEKCAFGVSKLIWAGIEVDHLGVRLPKKYIDKLSEWKVPKSTKESQAFFGFVNWMRSFTPRFSEITAPICETFNSEKKLGSFLWNDTQDKAFKEIIKELKASTKLYNVVYNQPNRPLHVYLSGLNLNLLQNL